MPIMIERNREQTKYRIEVMYQWFNSPHKDYTLSLYSDTSAVITNSAGLQNILHTDGNEYLKFSEFKSKDKFCGMNKFTCLNCNEREFESSGYCISCPNYEKVNF